MAASKSSGSNETTATIRSSESISATPSHSAPTSPGGAPRLKARAWARARRSPRVATTLEDMVSCADLDGGSQVRDVHLSAASNPGVDDATAIFQDDVVGQ